MVAALAAAALVLWLLAAHHRTAWPDAASQLLLAVAAVLTLATLATLGHHTRRLARQISRPSARDAGRAPDPWPDSEEPHP